MLGGLAGVGLMLALLYAAVAGVAYSADWYDRAQQKLGVEESGRLEMNAEMADYLAGDLPELSERFTQQEKLHMADVRTLFVIGRRIARTGWILFAAGLGCTCLLQKPSRGCVSILLGAGAFLALLAAMAVWALLDFSGWFDSMHRWVFTNDLWLFESSESAMIRILPLEFFTRAVTSIVLRFSALVACFAALCLGTRRILKRYDL